MFTPRVSVPLLVGVASVLAMPVCAESPEPVASPDALPPASSTLSPPASQSDFGASYAPFGAGGDWGGPYLGLQFAFAEADSNRGDDDAWTPGLLGGYRWDRGAAVWGVEVDYLQPDLRIRGQDVDYLVRFKGQLGYDFGNTLAYGVAGLSSPDSVIGDETGWLIGAGIDFSVSPSFLVGAELTYQEFDEFGNGGFSAEVTTAGVRASFRF